MEVKFLAIKEQAKKLLFNNLKTGYSKRFNTNYFFICPSLTTYPFQWFWDSCFHSISMSYFNVEFAKKEIFSLLSIQQKNGFIPHTIFWSGKLHNWAKLEANVKKNPYLTAEIQPPVIATSVKEIYLKDNDKNFLEKVFPQLEKYYNYLAIERDPENFGMLSIIQSRESGMDFSPQYDELWQWNEKTKYTLNKSDFIFKQYQKVNWNLKKIFKQNLFNVKDLLTNCIYAESLYDLSFIAGMLNEKEKVKKYKQLAKKVSHSIIKNCWCEKDKNFYSLKVNSDGTKSFLRRNTISSLMPIYLKDLPDKNLKDLMKFHLLNKNEFWLKYPLPSVAKNDVDFNPSESNWLWRGPTWINTNWFIYKGLKKHSQCDLAHTLKNKTIDLIYSNNFFEYYNPSNGKGSGAKNFGWSTLIVDFN